MLLLPCSPCCGCAGYQVTVKNCGNAPVPGASVTIGADTQTTNGSGVATFTSAAKGATITVTAPNYCTQTSTVPSTCTPRTFLLLPTSGYIVAAGVLMAIPSTLNVSYNNVYGSGGSTVSLLHTYNDSAGCSNRVVWCGGAGTGPDPQPRIVVWCACDPWAISGPNGPCNVTTIGDCFGTIPCYFPATSQSGSPLNIVFNVTSTVGCGIFIATGIYTVTP